MKTKNTSCLWRDTATVPRKPAWNWKPSRKKKTSFSNRKNQVANKPRKSETIKSSITLESLGLDFSKQVTVRKVNIVGI